MFFKNVQVLIDNQDETKSLLIDILAELTIVSQKNLGTEAYNTLSTFAKKGREFRNLIRGSLREKCLKEFKQDSLAKLDESHLKAFVELLKSNNYDDILDSTVTPYINKWLHEIYSSGFDLDNPEGE